MDTDYGQWRHKWAPSRVVKDKSDSMPVGEGSELQKRTFNRFNDHLVKSVDKKPGATDKDVIDRLENPRDEDFDEFHNRIESQYITEEKAKKYAKLKQRLAKIPDPDSPEGKAFIDEIMKIVSKRRREMIVNRSKAGKPKKMREDVTTPLIKEVPFGLETGIGQKDHGGDIGYGGKGNYDIPATLPHTDLTFDETRAKANELGLPKIGPFKKNKFHVIPHGGVSIPKEQKRKILPLEKRNWDKNEKLKAKAKRLKQREDDALEVALDVMNDEKPSRFVKHHAPKGKTGMHPTQHPETKRKIRPPKPVRSDFAEIITAKLKQRLSRLQQ